MSRRNNIVGALLCATSVVAISAIAHAQDAPATGPENIVVTGSRVITDITNSPTPITEVSASQLLQTTPIDIPTALDKLPVFFGSSTPDDPNNNHPGQPNGAKFLGNVLDLRNFGPQRTLVLLDGHRQTPSNIDGTIDIDTLPQTLMERVDVVTGGASAVYGSDAVTGVVNFILDKHFTGVKVDASAGISTYGDGASQQIALTAGTDLFGGRGHFEGSVRYFHQDGVLLTTRPWGNPEGEWSTTGAGTSAQPYQNVVGARFNNFAYGGLVSSCGGCAATGMQFGDGGVLTPFVLGAPTTASNVTLGGDGVVAQADSILAGSVNYQSFGRFSYNIDNSTTAYVQVIGAENNIAGYHVNNYVQSGAVPNQVFVNNPFLSTTAQSLLANKTGLFTDQQYFTFPYYPGYIEENLNRNLQVSGGLDGTFLGKYDWDLYTSFGDNRLKASQPNDQSNAKLAAAMDAVVNPANGQVVCEVSLTQYASLYPGCVPMNRFGPTATSQSAFNYVRTDSWNIPHQQQFDLGGSISGDVLDLPAGPLKAALDAEYRRLSYGVESNGVPGFVNCTGLRLCVANMAQTMHGVVLGQPSVSDHVSEIAGELDAPILKNAPLVQSLDLNLAGRYTDYSISGSVETWKIGLDYHVNDNIYFRGTTSVDIRAPTLQDLYAPAQITHIGFTDPHTGNQNQQVNVQTQGNIDLVPEVARTYTAGVVLTPTFAPGLTVSVDYYQIALKNAISSVSGTTTGVVNICEASNGTSPLCSLFERPLPFSDHSAANFPTLILSQNLNVALANTGGVDAEVDYAFDLADVFENIGGSLDLRSLLSYQPNNTTGTFVGAPTLQTVQPKGRLTTFVTYTLNSWTFALADRFSAEFNKSAQPNLLYFADPYMKSLNYLDLTVSKKFNIDGSAVEAYINVQNLINTPPPIEPAANASPGLNPNGDPGLLGIDSVGRYFTIGVRTSF